MGLTAATAASPLQAERVSDWIGKGDFVYRSGGPVPVFVEGRESILVDSDGYEYLDMEAANGSLAFGYDPSFMEKAVRATAQLPALPSFLESDLRLRLAEKLCRLIERELGATGRVAFDLGGGQGIELAMKIAHEATQREAVAVFEGAYHGRSIYTSHLSASQRYRDVAPHLQTGVVRLPCPETSIENPVSSPEQYFEQLLGGEAAGIASPRGLPIAALLFEPLLNVAGMREPAPAYLAAAVDAFRSRGALIVADEVFTGFYRTGPFLGVQRYGIVPDIIVLSKAITNGMAPLSCVWARDDLLSPASFAPGSHSVTFGNTPLCLAIAEAVVDRFCENPHPALRYGAVGEALARFADRASRLSQVENAKAIGAVARVRLRTPDAAKVREAALYAGRRWPASPGVLVASTGAAPNTVSLHPPLTSTAEEIDLAADILIKIIGETEH